MPYDEIEKMVFNILPNAMDTIIRKLPKDMTSLWAVAIASVSLVVSIVLPIITYFINKRFSAQQLRMLIVAYIESFERKVKKITEAKKWNKKTTFEEYNKKNYEMLESFLPQIHVLNRDERKVFIEFVIKFKTSDEMDLTNNPGCIVEFKRDLAKVKRVIINNSKMT